MKILLVCTANRCRSPMAAALLRAAIPTAHAEDLEITSAGRLESGVEASPGAVRTVAKRGLDLASHRSTRLTNRDASDADLILCMAREHLRDVVVLAPTAFPRTFTLKELVRRGALHGPRGRDQPLEAWLQQVGAGRRPQSLLGASPDDDVADPIGGPDVEYERTAGELAELCGRLSALLFPT